MLSTEKKRLAVLASSYESYQEAVNKCVVEQEDFLSTTYPFWCKTKKSLEEVIESNTRIIDNRMESVLCQDKGIDLDVM